MSAHRLATLISLALAFCFAGAAWSANARVAGGTRRLSPAGVQGVDNSTRIDINQISMPVTNTGSIAWDKTTGNAGLEFPRGTGETAVFAAGPWLGAAVGGQARGALSEYSDEFGPGAMIGTLPDDPNKPEYKVYKLNRVYANPADRDAALADYVAGAQLHGAPVVFVQGDGSLNIQGDQMLWCVFNDADPINHNNRAGSTAPLGVEVQLTAFAFNDPGPAGRTVFLRYKIINKGVNTLENMYVGMWSDPDLGYAGDDLVGCDPSRSLGYVYNASNADNVYGATPPAVGIDLLQGPTSASGAPVPMTAFRMYFNGLDPDAFAKSYNSLRGLASDGSPLTDPITHLPTTFELSGNPIAGTGWLDANPSDRRMLVSSGPAVLAPNQSLDLTYAIVVGQGTNRFDSIQQMLCTDDQMQIFYGHGFPAPPPAEGTCAPLNIVNCPRTADDWNRQFALGGGDFTPAQLTEIATRVDARSLYFDWGSNPVGGLSGALAWSASLTPQAQAVRQYAAFMCNVAASSPPVVPAGGAPVYLEPSTPVACPGLAAVTLQELAETGAIGLQDASYVNVGPNPTALAGVDTALPFFGGGAGYAADFTGSSIPSGSANTHSVEVRFTGGPAGQFAYRYQRTQDTFGSRVYMIQDYVSAPWTIWDLDTNTQLNGAFLENAGPPPAANLDGTWDPDASTDGGREYLWVMDSPYSGDGTPTSAYFTDPNLQDALLGNIDFRYVLWSHRVATDAVIDPGDVFRFTFGYASSPGVDTKLLQLAGLAPGDPATTQSYDEVTACLTDINGGIGIGTTCNSATATLISLVGADTGPDHVTLQWLQGGTPSSQIRVERRESQQAWLDQGAVLADGRGMIEFTDTHVIAGRTYSYRLHLTDAQSEQFAGETSVTVPLHAVLNLAGFWPNPAGRSAQVSFSLADASAATLTVFDIAGRRRLSRDVGSLGPGSHLLPLAGELPSGLYMLRLTQSGSTLTRKAMIVR